MSEGIATSYGLDPAKAVTIKVDDDEYTPPQFNDPAQTAQVRTALEQALGKENVLTEQPVMGSEDVGVFGDPKFTGGKTIPVTYFRLGAMDPAKLAAAQAKGQTLPGMHTSRFEPLPQPTLETGVKSMTAVAIALLQ
jgi:hippurate hydrolase